MVDFSGEELDAFDNASEGKTRAQRSDKGKKRGPYNLKIRAMRKASNDLRRTMEDIEKYQRIERRKSLQKSAKTQNQRRLEKRRAMLPVNRTCPLCGQVKDRSKQWVIDEVYGVICKACQYAELKGRCVTDVAKAVGQKPIDLALPFRLFCIKQKCEFTKVCEDSSNYMTCNCQHCVIFRFWDLMDRRVNS